MKLKKGISLIVLIITIIVVIILAAVVILTLSKNNPIESAKEARFKEDVRTFQDELALAVSKDYTNKSGARDNKFTATKFEKIKEYIPSFTENYKGKFVVKQDSLVYNEDKLTDDEKTYVSSLYVSKNVKTGAELVEDDPQNIYGEKVINYTSNGVDDWKIFYSDGSNVYLITSDYIDVDKLPETKQGHKPENVDSSHPKAVPFTNIINDYNGSSDITDDRIKALNYDYFIANNYSSTNNNMKAVAYMLDIDIWDIFAKGKNAEYAVGGPTIELFMKSYSQKNNVDYRAQASNSTGYQISKDGGDNWATYYGYIFDTNEKLFVLPRSKGADALWLASTISWNGDNIIRAHCEGNIGNTSYSARFGFRPMVCLKSDTMLKKVDGGYEIE